MGRIIENFNEFSKTNVEKKMFKASDISGRGNPTYKLSAEHIKKTWELDTLDDDGEETLGDFIDNCYIGDTWVSDLDKLECIQIL